MKNVIDAIQIIEFNNGKFPKSEIQQIIERKEEATPFLLKIMEEVRSNPQKYMDDPNNISPIYAVYLLAQFRVIELYPILIDILSLPDETPSEIFGDCITEDMCRILASVYAGNIQPLKNLIENSEVYEYVRGQALLSLVSLVLNDQLKREDVIDYFKQLLNGGLKDAQRYVNAEIVNCCNYLYPLEAYDDIVRLYERDEIDFSFIRMGSIDATLKMTKEEVLNESRQSRQNQFIENTITELQGWACFQEDINKSTASIINNFNSNGSKRNPAVKNEKIGRNDPCSCGSGQKYKKCCGK